ncbi:MPDZ isoform 7, partial [Pan troglodytes]
QVAQVLRQCGNRVKLMLLLRKVKKVRHLM